MRAWGFTRWRLILSNHRGSQRGPIEKKKNDYNGRSSDDKQQQFERPSVFNMNQTHPRITGDAPITIRDLRHLSRSWNLFEGYSRSSATCSIIWSHAWYALLSHDFFASCEGKDRKPLAMTEQEALLLASSYIGIKREA